MSQTGPSEASDSTGSKSTAQSLSAELDKLTTAVLEVSDNVQACAQESDVRHAAYRARAEEQKQRTTSFQDQIAKMVAMTQEGLRREREEPLKVPNPEKFQRNLQRAAFGTGGDSESASRSSMLESSRDSMSAESRTHSVRESQADSGLQPGDYPTGSPASVRASCGSSPVSESQSGILSDTSSWQKV
ncbi:hypothetical protein GSI_15351 [Ganoderma sinense ZZ0214-1]|uniref:Uncharacterized protein n=1 Tax=Ganoderma sinense ZZ0214-1 TaxID=1077348 RepID=A0A2G8RMC0_9APHY|nr:hypothetical protein GSI_15351 [Ganoderma sinense ZZ0214-1]